jgi:hypothetical protein
MHAHVTCDPTELGCSCSTQARCPADSRKAQEAEKTLAMERLVKAERGFVTKFAEAVTHAVLEDLSRHNWALSSHSVLHVSDIKICRNSTTLEYLREEAWQEQGFQAWHLLGRSTGGEDGVCLPTFTQHDKLIRA